MAANPHEAHYNADAARYQAQAEPAYLAFGEAAPMRVHGEPLNEYRRRLLESKLPHSPTWRGKDVRRIHDSMLDIVEAQVFADAQAAGRSNAAVGPGALRCVEEPDATGRKIRRFYGDPEACWGPFKQVPRVLGRRSFGY